MDDKKPMTVVMSKMESELAAERARAESEMNKKKKIDKKKVVKAGLVGLAILAGVGLLVFFVIVLLTGQYAPGDSEPEYPEGTPGEVLPTIEGYRCDTKLCFKAAELTENTILVRDTAYYIFNRETEEVVKTTIEAIEYRSFTPFNWGDKLLLVLERATGRQGLYSITANRNLTSSFNYTSFDRDIKAEMYKGMEWIEGLYILTHIANEVRMIDVRTGDEVVRAAEKIFVNRDFMIGYEANGQRRAYAMSGTRFLVVEAGVFLAIYDTHFVHVTGDKTVDMYNKSGTKLKTSEEYYKTFRNRLRAAGTGYAEVLRGMEGVFVVPT